MNQEMSGQITKSATGFRLPRYREIPNVGLYLEQTVKYIVECFAPLMDEVITSSMISNYVKRGLIANPIKKQYSREQIAYLIFIATIKTVLSMEDIKLMIRIQKKAYDPQVAYDYFCSEFENVLEYIFGFKQTLETVGVESSHAKTMLRDAIVTSAHMIHLNKLFEVLHQLEN